MVDGQEREAWNHTAELLAMLYNAHRDPKARTMQPAEFHPSGRKPKPVAKTKDLSILKQVFVER